MNQPFPKIVPHLWYANQAEEAARFYAAVFPHSKILTEATIKEMPSTDTGLVTFEIWKQKFIGISAGPHFTFSPSQSFMINFDPSQLDNAAEELEKVWHNLMKDGTVLMPLDVYPFSQKYGWIVDKFGLSWQLILTNPDGKWRPPVIPALKFTGENYGRAEEALQFYLSIFKDSKKGNVVYHSGEEEETNVLFADFMIENQWFAAWDSKEEEMQFNESVSYLIYCDSQAEIDYYWESLSAVPESEQCGWLKDKFGISWQVFPKELEEMIAEGTPEQVYRVNQATLKMKKLNIDALQRTYQGY